jgi:hypothetical protein
MKRRGRPPIDPEQRKSVVMCARLDAQTVRLIGRAVERSGLSTTDWVRNRLAKAAKREVRD